MVGGILVLSYRERTVPAAHFHFQGLKGWQTGFGTKSSSPNFSIKLTDWLRLNPESFWDNHLWRYPLTRSHFTKPLHKHKDARGQHSVQKPLSICLCIGSRYEQLPARSMWNSQVMNCTSLDVLSFTVIDNPNFMLLTAILKILLVNLIVCCTAIPYREITG